MRLPGGYVAFRAGPARIVALPAAAPFALEALHGGETLYGWAGRNASRTIPGGRAPVHVVAAPGGPCVVRHYLRGGAVATMLGDRYVRFGVPRPFRELWVSTVARSHGISTPEVIAAVVYPAGPVYRADIATRFVPDSATLADITFGDRRRPDVPRLIAWRAAGRAIRDAAAAGVIHADLNVGNLLIAGRPDAPVPFLLDLDRCRIVGRTTEADIAGMVNRLHRSTRKNGGAIEELRAFDEGVRG